MLGSVIFLQLIRHDAIFDPQLITFYGLIAAIFVLSALYALILHIGRQQSLFAYVQIGIDSAMVTVIIFLTGSFTSAFSFLYLVVIIYASMLLYRKGGLIMASLCCIEYGIMVDLEYYLFLKPFGGDNFLGNNYEWNQILSKVVITMAACFAVAFLSGFLAEQARRSKKELVAMEDHVKRVEKMVAMGEMAAGLAHEIKNPLASLSGSVQMLREDIEYNPDHDKLMQIVLRETDRLSSLVTSFLLFARPPAGKSEALELGPALQEISDFFGKANGCSGRIMITRELASDIWIEFDPMHLRQILWNLFLNAAEAIDGKGEIHIAMQPIQNKQVNVRISDDGCGMSPETTRSVFDPFFTTKPGGTGLGLSIVHSIVESYNNRLDVESTKGEGTTFTLRLNRIALPT
jgi:two-component system sensor histidine kinase PilS (NtrC family)